MSFRALGVRWTIGNVDPRGFQALRLSVWGAYKLFGTSAEYVICFNSVPLEHAQELSGELPPQVRWLRCERDIPDVLARRLEPGMAEGVAWKLLPLRVFEDLWELSLDNDCILWDLPVSLQTWLERDEPPRCLVAEDLRACFGQFVELCPDAPRNSGIRGLPGGFDLGRAFARVLARKPTVLRSECDEQGLQIAALSLDEPPLAVSLSDVSLCSPFHSSRLGRCGAHFVGLNSKELPWRTNGESNSVLTRKNWANRLEEVARRVGVRLDTPPITARSA